MGVGLSVQHCTRPLDKCAYLKIDFFYKGKHSSEVPAQGDSPYGHPKQVSKLIDGRIFLILR